MKKFYLLLIYLIPSLGHSQDLNVNGNIILPSIAGNKQIFTWDGNDANWRIGMGISSGFTRSITGTYVQYTTYYSGGGQGYALGVNGGQSSFEIAGSNHQAFFRGNVGIGTINPGSKLHIDGGHVYVGPLRGTNLGIGRIGVSGPTAEVSFSNRAATSFVESPTQGERWVIYNDGTPTDGRLRFWTNGDKMVLTKEGSVGIGTANPGSYKLAVAGKIAATGEVKVFVDGTTTFPDYVFDPSYKLPTLEETEKYVKENHHLPEVPTAADIAKGGMSLNEMNVILLKKVEELTLYMIEMKKENEALKVRMSKLEKK